MLPASVLVAPSPLRFDHAFPRALIVVWNLALFALVIVYAGRSPRMRLLFALVFVSAGSVIATAALFGTQWVEKAPALALVLSRIPSPLIGVFEGAESGFSPNQLAGSLLYVLPFSLAMLWQEMDRRRWLLALIFAAASVVIGLVLIASQSRAGLVGFAVSMLVWLFVLWRMGRRIIMFLAAAGVVALLLLPIPDLLSKLDAATAATSSGNSISVVGRLEIWQRAIMALADYPLTGMGLGTFRETVNLLYPLLTIAPSTDIAHAHNFFLQTALDFGIPGLVAILSVYMLALVQSNYLDVVQPFAGSRNWAAAFVATIAGTTVYGFFDAVAMGSKTNFLFWYFFALIFAVSPVYVQARRATGRNAC
jgi:putative inorganic carbon (HCO3(-)) transporter